MSRYAKANITISQLKEKIYSVAEKLLDKQISEGIHWDKSKKKLDDDWCVHFLTDFDDGDKKIMKDLSKIEFGFANSGPGAYGCDLPIFDMIGDFPVMWAWAANDCDVPIVFCIYIGEKGELRAYIPSDGNVYSHKQKCAYGPSTMEDEDSECDDEDSEFEDEDDGWDEYDDLEEFSQFIPHDGENHKYNADKMCEDVKNRIVVR